MKMINKQNGAAFTKTVCAIIFYVFSFSWFYFYQADLMAFAISKLSHQQVSYNDFVGALLFTLTAAALQYVTARLSRLPLRRHAATYLPSAFFIISVTAIAAEMCVESYTNSITWLSSALLIVGFLSIIIFRKKNKSEDFTQKNLWQNTLTMGALMLLAGLTTNGNDILHYRLKAERLLLTGKAKEALETGKYSAATDSSLTSLRIFALSQTERLGDELFEYPLTGASDALLPNNKSVCWFILPKELLAKSLSQRQLPQSSHALSTIEMLVASRFARKAAYDYLLCGYLLDRNLDKFAAAIAKHAGFPYNLPKHYREALTLYMHLRSAPVIFYNNNVMNTDFRDFQELGSKFADKTLQRNAVRDAYGNTYWFYYYYAK